MRKFVLLSLPFFPLFVWAQDKALSGAYKITKAFYGTDTQSTNIDKTTIIKIFKDGYWVAAFFGNPEKPFNGSGGGTYKTHDGKYIEALNFYSWDSTAVGSVYNFNYKVDNDKYFQEGKINSAKYHDYLIKEEYQKIVSPDPLKNASLEGAWKLQNATWGTSKLGEGLYKDVVAIKLFAYPRFAFAYYNEKTAQFVGAGGGTYQFDGTTISEVLEYWSWGKPKYPQPVFNIIINGDSFVQSGWEKGLDETWQKLK